MGEQQASTSSGSGSSASTARLVRGSAFFGNSMSRDQFYGWPSAADDSYLEEDSESPRSSSQAVVNSLTTQVDRSSIERIIALQRTSLSRFEKTNEMLVNCCQLSGGRLDLAKKDLVHYANIINDMRRDLESIFRRIRAFKNLVSKLKPVEAGEGASRVGSGSVADRNQSTTTAVDSNNPGEASNDSNNPGEQAGRRS